MLNLLKKYASNSLSRVEANRLKQQIDNLSDGELETLLHDIWEQESDKGVDPIILEDIKQQIDVSRLKRQKVNRVRWSRIGKIAAVMLPLMVSLLFFTAERRSTPPQNDMIVTVGAGERVSIVLPDGTAVRLNSETVLSYNINDFNRKFREINLEGEAFFEVAKNEKVPFVIKTGAMDIKVLGTVFNLQSRLDYPTSEINLIEGKVALTAGESRQEVLLFANQTAVFDKLTQKIHISKNNDKSIAAWTRGELSFQATPIGEVFKTIERHYGVKFHCQRDSALINDLFTGTFTIDDIHKTMDILKVHYQFDYSVNGKDIIIKNFDIKNSQTLKHN